MAIQSVNSNSAQQATGTVRNAAPAKQVEEAQTNPTKVANDAAAAKASTQADSSATVTNSLGQTLGQRLNVQA